MEPVYVEVAKEISILAYKEPKKYVVKLKIDFSFILNVASCI